MRKHANPVRAVEPLYTVIGQNIRKARERQGLTQDQLASRLTPKMARVTMANMEAGRQRIMLHVLLDIATACGTTIGRMLPGRERAA